MTRWREVTLAEVCNSIDDGDWIETKDQGGSDYRLLQVSNIGVGHFRETGKYRYVTQETFDRLRCHEIRPGMVLVARMPDPVGRAWYVDRLLEPAITAVDVAIVDPDPTQLDGRFCAYLLNSPQQLAHAAAVAGGTTRLRITRKQLAAFQLRLPDLPYQRAVARVLAHFDDLIENNRRRIELLEEMARAIYREWFVHFRYPGHEDIPLVDSPLGPIPNGWEATSLGDVLELRYGKALKKEDRRGGPVAVVSSAGVVGWHDQPLVKGPTIVVGRKGNVGSVTWVDEDAWPIDTAYFVATELPLRYVAEQLRSTEFHNTHAAVPGLSRDQAYSRPFLRPSFDLMDRFDETAAALASGARALKRASDRLAALRDLLLPKLVTGEIDVSRLDLDELVEEAVSA